MIFSLPAAEFGIAPVDVFIANEQQVEQLRANVRNHRQNHYDAFIKIHSILVDQAGIFRFIPGQIRWLYFTDVFVITALFKIELYAGGTLNRNPTKQLNIVRDGVAEIAFILPSYTPGTFMDDSVLEVPFVGGSALQTTAAFFQLYKKGLLRNYDTIVPLMAAGAHR